MSAKSKLLSKKRKLAQVITIEVDGEAIELHIKKPTMGDRIACLDAARAAGEMDAEGKPTSETGAALLMARIVATVLYDPESGQRMFSDSDAPALLQESWLEDVFPAAQKVFSPDFGALKND